MNDKEILYLKLIKDYQAIMAIHLHLIMEVTKVLEGGFSKPAIINLIENAERDIRDIHSKINLFN